MTAARRGIPIRLMALAERITATPRTGVALGLALAGLVQNPLRSALTAAGVFIGVTSVTLVAGVGEIAKRVVEDEMQVIGSRVLIVAAAPPTLGVRPLTLRDVQAVTDANPRIANASAELRAVAVVAGPDGAAETEVIGVTPAYFEIGERELAAGRSVTAADLHRRSRTVILGARVARELFGAEPPVGRTVRVNLSAYEVAGVLAPRGAGLLGDVDGLVIAPLTTVRDRLRAGSVDRPDQIDAVALDFFGGTDLTAEEGRVAALLRDRFRTRPGEPDPFSILSTAQLAERSQALLSGVQAALAVIAAISLVVGTVSVANITLVSVNERVWETGLRMALGAAPRDIADQFLFEATLLCIAGGAAGLAVAAAILEMVDALTGWPSGFVWTHALAALLASTGAGLAAGVAPAARAARLDPVEAMRRG